MWEARVTYMYRTLLREIILLTAIAASYAAIGKETRKVVAIIDTGISSSLLNKPFMCKDMHADFTGMGINDSHGHGSNIAGIIANKLNPKTHCLLIIKYWHTTQNPWGMYRLYEVFSSVLSYIEAVKPAYVNYSSAGFGFSTREFNVYSKLIDNGTKVVVAAGNDMKDLDEGCDTFPACYFFNEPNFYVVRASKSTLSNKNGPVNVSRPGNNVCGFGRCLTGTSQAAAQFTADLISKEK